MMIRRNEQQTVRRLYGARRAPGASREYVFPTSTIEGSKGRGGVPPLFNTPWFNAMLKLSLQHETSSSYVQRLLSNLPCLTIHCVTNSYTLSDFVWRGAVRKGKGQCDEVGRWRWRWRRLALEGFLSTTTLSKFQRLTTQIIYVVLSCFFFFSRSVPGLSLSRYDKKYVLPYFTPATHTS